MLIISLHQREFHLLSSLLNLLSKKSILLGLLVKMLLDVT